MDIHMIARPNMYMYLHTCIHTDPAQEGSRLFGPPTEEWITMSNWPEISEKQYKKKNYRISLTLVIPVPVLFLMSAPRDFFRDLSVHIRLHSSFPVTQAKFICFPFGYGSSSHWKTNSISTMPYLLPNAYINTCEVMLQSVLLFLREKVGC